MNFLMVFAALILVYYVKWPPISRLDEHLANAIHGLQGKLPEQHQWLLLLFFSILPTLVVALISTILYASEWGWLAIALTILLLACLLNLDQLSGRIQSLQTLNDDTSLALAREQLMPLIKVLRQRSDIDDLPEQERLLLARHALIYAWFSCTFITVFAFIISGIYGAIVITSLFALHRHTGLYGSALDLLEWVPARMLGLSFVLLGNFNKGFPIWLDSMTNPLMNAEQVLGRIADAACELDPNPNQTSEVLLKNLCIIDKLITQSGLMWLILLSAIILIRLL